MLSRGRFVNFTGSTLRKSRAVEDVDPMASLANLADCMLVLACGLMVALVVAWKIDINVVTEVEQAEDAQEISDIDSLQDEMNAGGSAYIDMGRVFQDPETGKLYMVEETDAQE